MDTLSPRQLWIAALRSGKYKQTFNALRRVDGYCCLGVACEVYQEHVGDLVIEEKCGIFSYDHIDIHLPLKVKKWLRLRHHIGQGLNGPCLMSLNDLHRKTFSEIADIIESNEGGYFES